MDACRFAFTREASFWDLRMRPCRAACFADTRAGATFLCFPFSLSATVTLHVDCVSR